MAKLADGSAVGRVALARDPGLAIPEDAFRSPLAGLLGLAGEGLRLTAKTIKDDEEEEESEASVPLPRRKPEPPEETARRLRHGAATTARRARTAAGRLEMTRAAQAVLAAPDTPATELPARMQAEAGKVLNAGLTHARRDGLPEADLARLEADLGAQELLLVEQGLAEQVTRLQAGTEAQLEAEAAELIEAVRRDPARAPSAEAALTELLADFAPGFQEGALQGFDAAARRRLAAAEVEGLLARGDLEASKAALARAQDLPEALLRHFEAEIAAQGARQHGEDRGLATARKARLVSEVEAGRPADPLALRALTNPGGPESRDELDEELKDAAERRRLALRLLALPPADWLAALADFGVGADQRDAVLRLAEPLRRRFELDPRGAVAARVEAKVAALEAQGRLGGAAGQAEARRFFATAFQREAGIAAPRLFTNQERADWVQAYLQAEPEARPALLLAARAEAPQAPDAAALAELTAGLPPEARAEAEAQAAMIADLEEAGIDPAGVDLTRADPDSLFGLRTPRPAQAPQLAQAGGDDGGGDSEASGVETFRRRPGESNNDWALRLEAALKASQRIEERLPIYEAFFEALEGDQDVRLALAQGVGPEDHLTADLAPDHIQQEAQSFRQGSTLQPEDLPPTLSVLYFVGPDERLYWRFRPEPAAPASRSLLPGFLRTLQTWMASDGIEDDEEETFLQPLSDAVLEVLFRRNRLPHRSSGITQGGGRSDGRGRGSGDGPERSDQGDPGAEEPGGTSASGSQQASGRAGTGGAALAVGQPDPVLTSRTIVQPVEDRRRLLEMAAEAKPGFDRQLEAIAKAVPGTKADLSRVKEDGPRLTFKIKSLQNDMRKVGSEPASPDSGAHLIRDYLAGRLVPDNDRALESVLARVRKDFGVVDVKDFMTKPNPVTGYTALHLQLEHKNGFTIELQITPLPFQNAADEQRAIFEKYRDFGDDIPDSLLPQYQSDLARSRAIFDRAWEKWLGAGNGDPRIER